MDNSPDKLNVFDQIVTNIYVWIGIIVAGAVYMAFYLQLPDEVQIWLDPRLLLFAIGMLVVAGAVAFRAIRSKFQNDPANAKAGKAQRTTDADA